MNKLPVCPHCHGATYPDPDEVDGTLKCFNCGRRADAHGNSLQPANPVRTGRGIPLEDRNPWTEEEDQALVEACKRGMTWEAVAASLGTGRTASACSTRMQKMQMMDQDEQPGRRRWTKEEDERVAQGYLAGLRGKELAEFVGPGRTPLSCRGRIQYLQIRLPESGKLNRRKKGEESMKPEENINVTEGMEPEKTGAIRENRRNAPWTGEEDRRLEEGYGQGLRGEELAEFVGGNRTNYSCEWRIRVLQGKIGGRMQETTDGTGEPVPLDQAAETPDLEEIQEPPPLDELANMPGEGEPVETSGVGETVDTSVAEEPKAGETAELDPETAGAPAFHEESGAGNNKDNPERSRRKRSPIWTPEEDERLKTGYLNGVRRDKLAELVGNGRTPSACLKRIRELKVQLPRSARLQPGRKGTGDGAAKDPVTTVAADRDFSEPAAPVGTTGDGETPETVERLEPAVEDSRPGKPGDPEAKPVNHGWLDLIETLSYNLGCAVNHIILPGTDGGDPVRDLEMARFHIEREINRLRRDTRAGG